MVGFSKITTAAVNLLGYRVAGVVVCPPATAMMLRATSGPRRPEEIRIREVIDRMLLRARDIQALAVVCGASWVDVSRSVVLKHRTGNRGNSLIGVNRFVLRLIFSFLRNPRNINVNAASILLGYACLWDQHVIAKNVDMFVAYLPLVMELLSFQNIDVNKSLPWGNRQGDTPLTIVCAHGKLPIVKALLAHGSVDINKPGDYGKTPLIYASTEGKLRVVQALLSCDDVDISKTTHSGGTALTHASNVDVVRELLSCEGIDVNWSDNRGATALWYASERGDLPVVRELLSCEGIDVNRGDDSGWTPLMKVSCPDVAKALLAHKDINVYAKTHPYKRRGRKFSGGTALDIQWKRCQDCVRYNSYVKTHKDYEQFSHRLEIVKMLEPFGRSKNDLWGQFRGQPRRPKSLNSWDRPEWYKWYKWTLKGYTWEDVMNPVEPVKPASEKFDEDFKNMYHQHDKNSEILINIILNIISYGPDYFSENGTS